MKNKEIREALRASGMKHWQLADALGIDETTLCRWLRKELPNEQKTKILSLIKKEGESNGRNVVHG